MELKHFSHKHGLVLQQLPQGSQHLCSGCKSPTSGNVYICWQCLFFLHEQCFCAPRSLNHPSHPLHPLTLMPCPTCPSSSFICNSCNTIGDAFSYSCSQCDFDAHLHCALTPNTKSPHSLTATHFSHPHPLKQIEMQQQQEKLTCSACTAELSAGTAYCCAESNCTFNLHKACFDAPREVHHKSHPHHPLTLLPAPPPYSGGGGFACNACHESAAAFVYNCAACAYGLHIDCIQWPESITRGDHEHALSLYYSPPYDEGVVFGCDVCGEAVHQKRWMYCCRDCDYGTHPQCVFSDRVVRQETADVQVQMMRFQQLQMMNMNSQLQIQQLQMNMNSQLHMQRLTMQSSSAAHVRDSI